MGRALAAAVLAVLWALANAGHADVGRTVRFTADPLPADPAAWQAEFRSALAESLGVPVQPPATPVPARVTEALDVGVYRRERVELEVEPGTWAPAYVFVPTHERPVAIVLALHGHGPGKSLTVGHTRTEADRIAVSRHQRAFGREAALLGYAVIVPDQVGFGERMDPGDVAAGALNSCPRAHADAIARGGTLIGERVREARLWITYATARPDMDGTRVDVAIVSGWFGTWRDSIQGLPHCVCNEIAGMEALAEIGTLACLIAPRPLLISLGAEDEWMPAAPARDAFAPLPAFFAATGGAAPSLRFGPGGHQVYGSHVWPFLAEHLPVETAQGDEESVDTPPQAGR